MWCLDGLTIGKRWKIQKIKNNDKFVAMADIRRSRSTLLYSNLIDKLLADLFTHEDCYIHSKQFHSDLQQSIKKKYIYASCFELIIMWITVKPLSMDVTVFMSSASLNDKSVCFSVKWIGWRRLKTAISCVCVCVFGCCLPSFANCWHVHVHTKRNCANCACWKFWMNENSRYLKFNFKSPIDKMNT